MCGRVHVKNQEALADYWLDVQADADLDRAYRLALPKVYNIAPTEQIPVARAEGSIETARWGLTLPNPRAGGFNARRESLGIYAGTTRVVVLVSGFYEWKRLGPKLSQPFSIQRSDGAPLVFAGLADETGVAIVTAPARGLVARIHDRMPAVLERDEARRWLDASTPGSSTLDTVSADKLYAYAVANDVGDARNDRPELLEEVPELPPEAAQLGLFGEERRPPRRGHAARRG
jgi:putative SOS response-associated peptidase YedK